VKRLAGGVSRGADGQFPIAGFDAANIMRFLLLRLSPETLDGSMCRMCRPTGGAEVVLGEAWGDLRALVNITAREDREFPDA
jgi:hypothetical protein